MAMSEGAQFILFCTLQPMDAEVPDATQNESLFVRASGLDGYFL